MLDSLSQENKVENSYFVYPSILRMLNLNNDSSFNALVRDVRRLRLMNLRVDSFSFDQMNDFSVGLQEKEQYDTYMEIEDTDQVIYLLGKDSPQKVVALANLQDRYYIVDIDGQLNMLQLPKLIESFSNMDSTQTSGFSTFFDLISRDADRERQRRERRRQWREKQAEKQRQKEAEASKADTTAAPINVTSIQTDTNTTQ
ncbi:MAG: hypothetical protein AAF990_00830 [Bacteroidota bacterium]